MAEPDDTRRQDQLRRLDVLQREAQNLIERPRYHLHEGAVVTDPVTGEPLRDDGPTLRGLDVELGVLRLRAQILGLDAPQRHLLVDEAGNVVDLTSLVPMARRLGLITEGG